MVGKFNYVDFRLFLLDQNKGMYSVFEGINYFSVILFMRANGFAHLSDFFFPCTLIN